METPLAITTLDEKKILEFLLDNPELRRQRILFNRFLFNPIWWIAYKPNGKQEAKIHPKCAQIWSDPRLESLSCKRSLLAKIAARHKELSPFVLHCKHGLSTLCVPLDVGGKKVGVVCMAHLRPAVVKKAPVELLVSVLKTLLVTASRDFELRRLSESVRPRAIALSTVHTVHRIINSTLNLDELVNRLAHLTAQVLRAKTCAIFLVNNASGKTKASRTLVERARAGAPKSAKLRVLKHSAEALENRVFHTARNVIRRNVICVPLIDEDVIGVIALTDKKEGGKFDAFDQEILTTLAEEAVIAIKNAQLYEEQKRVTLGAIQSLAAILGARFAHTRKLSADSLLKITLAIAEELHLSEEEKQAVHYATLLKDAGKIGLPDEIFQKPTKLTGEEYRLVKQHPVKGAMIIQSFESLKPVAPIILYSHEHYDGSGYPQGLKGHEIPMGGRILAVVNAFDALIAGRPYKTRATLKEALEELKRHRSTQFDPKVVDAMVLVMARPAIVKLLAGMA